MPPASDQDERVQVQNLEADFGALITRLADHADAHRPIVVRALDLLVRDFGATDELGPTRAARFTIAEPAPPDELKNSPPTPTVTSRTCSTPAATLACSLTLTTTKTRVDDGECSPPSRLLPIYRQSLFLLTS